MICAVLLAHLLARHSSKRMESTGFKGPWIGVPATELVAWGKGGSVEATEPPASRLDQARAALPVQAILPGVSVPMSGNRVFTPSVNTIPVIFRIY